MIKCDMLLVYCTSFEIIIESSDMSNQSWWHLQIKRFVWVILLLMVGVPAALPQESSEAGTDDGGEQTEEVEMERLVFWSTEFQPVRVSRQQALIDKFESLNPNIEIELVVVDTALIDQLLRLADSQGQSPDMILHPLLLTARWERLGLLNVDYATRMVETLGLETFAQGALSLNRLEDGRYAAIPSDGWELLIIYRRDWFAEAELAAPTSFDLLREAAQTLHDPRNDRYGMCIPTDPEAAFTWQVFEQLAIANNAHIYNAEGQLSIETEAFMSAADLYVELVRDYSQNERGWTLTQIEDAYLSGKCAMMFASSALMTDIAGLNEFRLPTCPECQDNLGFLAEISGFVSLVEGETEDAVAVARGEVNNIGIGKYASEAVADFILYYFNEGYLEWLAADPQMKLPMRRGTRDDEDLFVNGWFDLVIGFDHRVPLRELYPESELTAVLDGATRYRRLGLDTVQAPLLFELQSQTFIQRHLVDAAFDTITVEEALQNIRQEIESLAAGLLTE